LTLDHSCKENSAFNKFIQDGENMLWGDSGNTIKSFFVLPAQRIVRYVLFLKRTIKFMAPDHPDYYDLVVLLKEMELISSDINESLRKEDEGMKEILASVQNKVEPMLNDLIQDGRILKREGKISQFDTTDNKIKERYYFLFNDILLITKVNKNGKYKMKVYIPLNTATPKDIPDSQNFLGYQIKNAFEIHTLFMAIMFLAMTPEDKEAILDMQRTKFYK